MSWGDRRTIIWPTQSGWKGESILGRESSTLSHLCHGLVYSTFDCWFFFKEIFYFLFPPKWMYVHVNAGSWRGQKGVSDPLEQKIQVVVGCQTWLLGTDVRSSGRAVLGRNHWAAFPVSASTFAKSAILLPVGVVLSLGKWYHEGRGF